MKNLLLHGIAFAFMMIIYSGCQPCDSCCKQRIECEPQTQTEFPNDKYFIGKVIIPAKSSYSTGMIRVLINENAAPLNYYRGITYSRKQFNTADYIPEYLDTVYFKVKKLGDILLATDVTTDKSAIVLYDPNELLNYQDKFDIDLHIHPTEKMHTKLHVMGINGSVNASATDGTSIVVVNLQKRNNETNAPEGPVFTEYVLSSNWNQFTSQNPNYSTLVVYQDIVHRTGITVNGTTSTQDIKALTLTHTHGHP